MVLEGTFSIDQFHENTRDKSIYQGHYYSDKAPGLAFMGVIPFRVSRQFMILGGQQDHSFVQRVWTEHLTTLFTVGLLSALLGVFIFRFCRKLTGDTRHSLFLAAAYGVATPVLAYASLFFSHQATAALLFFSFICIFHAGEYQRSGGLLLTFSGFFAGSAAVSEYPAGLAVLCIMIYLILVHRSFRSILYFVIGLLPPLLLCGYYHAVCFDSPFVTAYSYKFFYDKVHGQGFSGITLPSLRAMAYLLFSLRKGLFVFSPFFLLSIPGYYFWYRAGIYRREWFFFLLFPIFYLVILSGFTDINAGWSLGPRHLIAAWPFLAVPAVFTFTRFRTLSVIVVSISLLIGLAAVSVKPEIPALYPFPHRDFILPNFPAGNLSINSPRFNKFLPLARIPANDFYAFNLGEAAGLKGLWSLIPLIAGWGTGVFLFFRISR